MTRLDWNVLDLDYEQEATRIAARLREIVSRTLHRRGLVVAISGGIDSSCSIALAVRALGPERVFALILPERDSNDDSAARANILAQHLGVRVQIRVAHLEVAGPREYDRRVAGKLVAGRLQDRFGPFRISICGGLSGKPSAPAVRFASTLSPIVRICSGFGPTKISPCASTISANCAFSERKP